MARTDDLGSGEGTPWVAEPGSLHDPGARVIHAGGRILRLLDDGALAEFDALSRSGLGVDLDGGAGLVGTRPVPLPDGVGSPWVAALQHDRVPVVSYPFEWTFSMLQDAALLHLDLVERGLCEGFLTKDGTPYNILFRGSRPLFVDVASFERTQPGEPWYGYRQFCQLFLNPLLVEACAGVRFQPWLRGSLKGISPAECAAVLPRRHRLRPSVLPHVGVQAWADRKYARSPRDLRIELKAAGLGPAVLRSQVRRMRRLIGRLRPGAGDSAWSGYGARGHYSEGDLAAKEKFVRAVAGQRPRVQVLDLGANDGRFTEAVMGDADYAVAVDSDAVVVDRLYRRLREQRVERILPLCMDLTDLSGGLGWAGRQRQPLTERVAPDLVLFLAVIHHLAITESIPLEVVMDWLAAFGAETVVEFVSETDPLAASLVARKRGNRSAYSEHAFGDALTRRFETIDRLELPSMTRTLYHLRPKG